ncbi:MAG: DUF308 domain-containing protein [Peptostreptococcaceae bacterium]|nr:DUF308 domain-containing protein [Peptostreptococcaceae bacterium]
MRILTIISGLLMMLAGVWCFANPGASFMSLAFILGIVMIIAGLTGAVNYFTEKNRNAEAGWVIAESILTFILGCIVLLNQIVVDAMVLIFFGMWLLYSGSLRIVAAFQLRKLKEKAWHWTLVFGVLASVIGLYAFINPLTLGLSVILMVGAFFIVQGANVLVIGINMPHKKKYFI